jgi:hypothetical protein
MLRYCDLLIVNTIYLNEIAHTLPCSKWESSCLLRIFESVSPYKLFFFGSPLLSSFRSPLLYVLLLQMLKAYYQFLFSHTEKTHHQNFNLQHFGDATNCLYFNIVAYCS